MKKVIITFAAVAGMAFNAAAFAEDEMVSSQSQTKTATEQDANGNYHTKRTVSAESTDAVGTTTSTQTNVKVDANTNGNDEKTVTTETTVDPKGLMNKKKTVVTDSIKHKDGKREVSHQKKVNGTTVEESTEETTPEQQNN